MLLTGMCLLYIMTGSTQDNFFFINNKLGISNPMDEYYTYGYASGGLALGLEAGYMFEVKKTTMGPAIAIGYFQNALDIQQAWDNDGLDIKNMEGPYTNVFIGTGYMANWHLSKVFALTGHVMLGMLNSTIPAMEIWTDDYIYSYMAYTSNAFTIKPGLGLRLFLGRVIVLSAEVELLYAEQEFGSVGVLNVNSGFGVRF